MRAYNNTGIVMIMLFETRHNDIRMFIFHRCCPPTENRTTMCNRRIIIIARYVQNIFVRCRVIKPTETSCSSYMQILHRLNTTWVDRNASSLQRRDTLPTNLTYNIYLHARSKSKKKTRTRLKRIYLYNTAIIISTPTCF